MSRIHRSRMLLLLSVVWAAAMVAAAQGVQGTLSGRVTDATGAVETNASVTITNEQTGVSIPLKTNSAGEYTYPSLNAGAYTVTVSAPGFQTYTRNHVQVDVDTQAVVDVALQLGKRSESITVSANAQRLDYDSANLGMTIEEKSITDLPLIYGNPFALEFLTPGVTFSGVNPNIHVYDSGTANVSVNGSALNSLDYKLDGAPDNRIRYSAFTPSTEFVSQYRVSTASYDASQGHSSGGFVNVQTKSGTNRFHGSIFGYYQNPKINANEWALNPTDSKPVFVREGAGVGGPIIKDKLFFFAGYEHSRQGSPNVQTLTVPTQAERNGDFSALLSQDTGLTCGSTPTTFSTAKGAPHINNYQLFDPTSVVSTGSTSYSRLCIPGNIIPAQDFSPIAKALLSYYPLPNIPGSASGQNNFVYSAVEPDRYYGAIARIDYTISSRQSMYGHILSSSRKQGKNNWFPPVSGTNLDYENRGVDLGYTFVLSPTTVLNAVVAVTRFTNQNTPTSQGLLSAQTIGMPSYLTSGLPATASSLPRIDLTGYTSATTASATQAEDNIGLFSLGVTKQLGNDTLHFGVEYRHYLTSGLSGQGEQGSYSLSGNQLTATNTTKNSVGGVGFSIAQLEFGSILDSGSQTQNSDFSVKSDYYAGYVHNDWRVTPKMTLNLGIRWEYETPDVERNAKQAVAFDFSATNAVTASGAAAYKSVAPSNSLLPSSVNPTGGFIFANTNGYGLAPYTAPKWDFSPRLGFSYALSQKTVMRGGYGIFYDSLNSYYLSGGNGGSSTTFLVPQLGYSSVSSVIGPSYSSATGRTFTALADPFPNGLTPASGNSLGTSTALGQNVQFLDPHPHMPYNQRWSFGFQHQFGGFIAALDYVGNHGVHLPAGQISQGTNTGGFEYNNVPVQYYSTVDGAYDQAENIRLSTTAVTNPFYKLLPSNSANSLGSKTVSVAQLLRPYPEFASINSYKMEGMSIYHSLQAQIQRRFSSGLSLTAAFTWSRTLDATTYLNSTDVQPWYGLSTVDRPLRYSMSGIYQLPWGRGRRWLSGSHSIVAQAVGGWQIQGVYQIQSGAPLNFTRNDVWYGNGNPGNSAWSRSRYKASIAKGGVGYWFDTSQWLQPASNISSGIPGVAVQTCPTDSAICAYNFPGTYQIRHFPLRFNTLRADNMNQADVGLQRVFQLWKLGTLQIRGEAINVLNHPVYSAPNTDPENSQFGQIRSQANQPRVFQFAGFIRF